MAPSLPQKTAAHGAHVEPGGARRRNMNLFAPPAVIRAEIFSRMPDALRRPKRTQWGDFNKAGQPVDCFLEGPSFDADGQLVVTDIPHGRIFKVSPSGAWTPVAEYDGWPNGL